jgi:hypothetical protein
LRARVGLFSMARLAAGKSSRGLLIVSQGSAIGDVVEAAHPKGLRIQGSGI